MLHKLFFFLFHLHIGKGNLNNLIGYNVVFYAFPDNNKINVLLIPWFLAIIACLKITLKQTKVKTV